jgi:hypothetical protein
MLRAARAACDCLKSYQAAWTEDLRTYKKTPLHDWSSHGADAFRYLAMAWREPMVSEEDMTPLERLRQEIQRPRTMNSMWEQYANEMRERNNGELPDENFESFNLSNNNMEMK